MLKCGNHTQILPELVKLTMPYQNRALYTPVNPRSIVFCHFCHGEKTMSILLFVYLLQETKNRAFNRCAVLDT